MPGERSQSVISGRNTQFSISGCNSQGSGCNSGRSERYGDALTLPERANKPGKRAENKPGKHAGGGSGGALDLASGGGGGRGGHEMPLGGGDELRCDVVQG